MSGVAQVLGAEGGEMKGFLTFLVVVAGINGAVGWLKVGKRESQLACANSTITALRAQLAAGDSGECRGDYIVLTWLACTPDGRLAGQRDREVRVSPGARILAIEPDGSVMFPVEVINKAALPRGAK
jgi:hypothetical protein